LRATGEIIGLNEGHERDLRLKTRFTVVGRRYFVSAQKFVGLVLEAGLEGHLICIFFGGKTLFLARRLFGPVTREYCLVGGCYMHSIMESDAADRFEKRKEKPMDFCLI